MDGTTMTLEKSAVIGSTAVAFALMGTIAVGSLPLIPGLVIAATLIVAVAISAQSRRITDEGRFVYRPVYVRSRIVHRRLRSLGD